jgi:hypothetical protein
MHLALEAKNRAMTTLHADLIDAESMKEEWNVYCLLAVIPFIFTTLVPNLFCYVQIHVFFKFTPMTKDASKMV